MTIVKSCCGCLDLVSGGYLFGWMGVVSGVVDVIGGILDQTHLNLGVVMGVMAIIASILLLVGNKKERKILMLPWLLVHMMSIMMFVGYFFMLIATDSEIAVVTTLLMALGMVLATGIYVYVWVCILSLYQLLGEKSRSSKAPPAVDGEGEQSALPLAENV